MTTPGADEALSLIAAARAAAERIDCAMAFAVVDAGGHPLAMLRMDGASLLAATTVLGKARTAVFCQRPTHLTVERAGVFPEVWQSLGGATHPPLVLSMGGFPLYRGGTLAGGLASSGGTGEQDIEASSQALAAWQALGGDPA
jgi:glc operon protein GlcG